jgi:hypothetical protein
MTTELPIACSLTAAEMPARLAEMGAIGRASLLDAETSGRRARLRFRMDDGTRTRLRAIVAAESECCAFLTMRLEDEPGVVALAIDGPEGSEPVIAELVQAFAVKLASCERARHRTRGRGSGNAGHPRR